jgi:hypothetical protein
MAEHQQVLQAAFPLQPLEAEQGTEGFTGAGTGVDQHIVVAFALESPAQQLKQLRLPLAWLHGWLGPLCGGAVLALWRLGANRLQRAPGQAQIERQRSHPAILLAGSEKR